MAEIEKMSQSSTSKRVLEGVVLSNKMDKTFVVKVVRRLAHVLYGKTITKSKKYKVHDEENMAKIGDWVEIGGSLTGNIKFGYDTEKGFGLKDVTLNGSFSAKAGPIEHGYSVKYSIINDQLTVTRTGSLDAPHVGDQVPFAADVDPPTRSIITRGRWLTLVDCSRNSRKALGANQ